VVAGVAQEESNMDVKTSKLTKEPNTDFLLISLLLHNLAYGFDTRVGILFFLKWWLRRPPEH
jgi:hypothetical protein